MNTIALVIGNDNYYENAKLENAVSDANGMSNVFSRLGYNVIDKYNCQATDYADLLLLFEKEIKKYDASIFYFAGHGFEIDGENYLAAIDCQVANPNKYHCGQTCIKLSEILSILSKNPTKINIVIIDACRKSFDRSGSVSLAAVQAPRGTLLAFSTSPNEGASDVGFEGHSIYTGALLKYIGREHLSVEELFKKVRKTVYNISGGRQTTWEHTSLIGDFYFNTGQLVHSVEIPYDEKVIKDVNYNNNDDFGKLIRDLKSYNWDIQNPAIDSILSINPKKLDKNQQFILGRNLLQASGAAFNASNFMENLPQSIEIYNIKEENHVLNGILFEIYYNGHGEFRREKTKTHFFSQIISLRKIPQFNKSFDFIRKLLSSTDYNLIYIPEAEDSMIDVDVVASKEKVRDFIGEEKEYEVISSIIINSVDVIKELSKYDITGRNEAGLIDIIAAFITAPEELININSNITLSNVAITKPLTDEEDLLKW